MPLASGSSAAGASKLLTAADVRHVSAAGPASHPPWTQGTSSSSLQTDNHTNTPSLNFYTPTLPF